MVEFTFADRGPYLLDIALALTAPDKDQPGIEVAGGGYIRKRVYFVRTGDDHEAVANTETFEWPRATSFWGDVGWLTCWFPDGTYFGWGEVVSLDDEITPTSVRIDRGDVARIKAGDLVLRGGYWPPRPYSMGPYSVGPFSRNMQFAAISATFRGGFLPSGTPCPGGSNWQMQDLPAL